MVAFRVILSPEALEDLDALYAFIARRSSERVALGYLDRIEAYCLGFVDFPHRGTLRDDLRPGTRVIGFERRVMIAFHIDGDLVVFDRILYGGRSLDRLSDDED